MNSRHSACGVCVCVCSGGHKVSSVGECSEKPSSSLLLRRKSFLEDAIKAAADEGKSIVEREPVCVPAVEEEKEEEETGSGGTKRAAVEAPANEEQDTEM